MTCMTYLTSLTSRCVRQVCQASGCTEHPAPAGAKTVTLEEWRERFQAVVTIDPTDDPKERRQRSEARRQKFNRARDDLLAAGVCGTVNGLWWLS